MSIGSPQHCTTPPCRELQSINRQWNDEKLYQESRRILNAEYQHILYNEFLPKLIGRKGTTGVRGFPINVLTRGFSRDYSDKFIPNSAYLLGTAGHGWDDISPNADSYEEGGYEEMRGIFYAMGPSFKSGYAQEWIKLVDEYQILARVTGAVPEPHSGNWERVQGMLV